MCIHRRIDQPLDINNLYNALGDLREDVLDTILPIKTLPGLSMNLLGAGFDPAHHAKYATPKPCSDLWNGSEQIFWTSTRYFPCAQACKAEGEFTNAYLFAENIHNQTYPSPLPGDPKQANATLQKLGLPSNTANIPCALRIEHRPTNLNYWHVELHILMYNQPIQKTDSAYKKKAAELALKQHLCKQLSFEIPDKKDPIPPKYYLKIS